MIDKEHKFCIGKNDHSWEVGYDKGYEQGKADAIDECMEIIDKIMPSEPSLIKSKHYENWKMKTTELRMLRTMLEKLKNQKKQ